MGISWEQFLLAAQVVITIQLFMAVLITFFRKGKQAFLLAYTGLVLLISYNLFLIQGISPQVAEIAKYGNLIYGYLYFPVLLFLGKLRTYSMSGWSTCLLQPTSLSSLAIYRVFT